MRRPVLVPLLLLTGAAHAQTLQPAGPPVPFAPDGLVHAVVAPGTGRVALTTANYAGLWVREPDGALRRLTDEPSAGFGATWSPDGTALAARVARFSEAGRADAVKVYDAATGAATTVRDFAPRVATVPAWSGDGAAVVLAGPGGAEVLASGRAPVAAKAGAAAAAVRPAGDGLVRVGPDGATAPIRLPVEGPVLRVAASPDGARLAVEVMGQGIVLVDADGRNAVFLGRGEAPAWSPDGRHVAYSVMEDDGHTVLGADLHVATADGARRYALTATPGVAETHPAWLGAATLLYDDLDAGRVMRLPLTTR